MWITTGYAVEKEANMEAFKYIEMFYNPTHDTAPWAI
jgi:hypothetical protein